MEIVKARPRLTTVKNPERSQPTMGPRLDLEDLYCVLQMQSDDSFIAMELATRLRSRGRLNEALKIMRNVVGFESCFASIYLLGQIEYDLDLIEEAFNHLQQALLIAPEEPFALFELLKTLGNVFVRKGDFISAEDTYYKAHRLNPNSDVLLVNLGTLAVQKSDWDLALLRFRNALALHAQNDKAWVGLSLCHKQRGDRELAWGNLEAALSHNPLNELALGLALEWATQEVDAARVLELLRAFLVAGGWNENLSLAFAWLCSRRGDLALARLELERLLTVNPQNLKALALVEQIRRGIC